MYRITIVWIMLLAVILVAIGAGEYHKKNELLTKRVVISAQQALMDTVCRLLRESRDMNEVYCNSLTTKATHFSDSWWASGHAKSSVGYYCATWFAPMGSQIVVSDGVKLCTCRVVDRGPGYGPLSMGVGLDLSPEAFKVFAPLSTGRITVTWFVVPANKESIMDTAPNGKPWEGLR